MRKAFLRCARKACSWCWQGVPQARSWHPPGWRSLLASHRSGTPSGLAFSFQAKRPCGDELTPSHPVFLAGSASRPQGVGTLPPGAFHAGKEPLPRGASQPLCDALLAPACMTLPGPAPLALPLHQALDSEPGLLGACMTLAGKVPCARGVLALRRRDDSLAFCAKSCWRRFP